jgi:hypothetical protein
MKFTAKLAAVMVSSIVPLAVLATAAIFCMSSDHSTQQAGIAIILLSSACAGIGLGVKVMDVLDV